MKLDNVKNILNENAKSDQKHKLNVVNKEIPMEIINEIEQKGVTIERIDELIRNGYPVFKYITQITIHGVCKELKSDRIGGGFWGYKSLLLNKNGSLGVKWIAVDHDKKKRICNTLGYFGWSTRENSTELHPFMMQGFSTAQDAIDKCKEYYEIAKRIDKELFYGSYQIYIGTYWGRYYAVFDVFVNGIPEENVDTLIHQITGLSDEDIQSKIKEIEDAYNKRQAEFKKECEKKAAESRVRDAEIRTKLLEWLNNNGYVEAISTDVPIGMIVARMVNGFNGPTIKFYKMTKKVTTECNQQGESKHRRAPYHFRDKAIKVYIKK